MAALAIPDDDSKKMKDDKATATGTLVTPIIMMMTIMIDINTKIVDIDNDAKEEEEVK